MTLLPTDLCTSFTPSDIPTFADPDLQGILEDRIVVVSLRSAS